MRPRMFGTHHVCFVYVLCPSHPLIILAAHPRLTIMAEVFESFEVFEYQSSNAREMYAKEDNNGCQVRSLKYREQCLISAVQAHVLALPSEEDINPALAPPNPTTLVDSRALIPGR